MANLMQPTILLLKEGTDTSQGIPQLVSNINACQVIGDILRTTLGPRGMDKLIHNNGKVVISNDGATIIKCLDIVHPASKTLVDIGKSQDDEVGDGTTSVVLLACELLKASKPFVEDSVHPQIIIRAFRNSCQFVLQKIRELAVSIDNQSQLADVVGFSKRELLERCASTALNSKLICGQKDLFAPMAVDAIMALDDSLDLKMVGIKKVPGGSVTDSFLVEGVCFKKTFSYAGFEQQPKSFDEPLVAVLNVELELKNEKENAEIRLSDPEQYQSIVDAEWKIIYDKLDKIVQSGARVVLSKLPIGDLATQYFADRDIFCAGRVPDDDLERIARATGAAVQTSLNDLNDAVLGKCKKFEEKQVGDDRYNFLTGCPSAQACSIILRGGAEQFIAEAERSLHDAICIVRRAVKHSAVVAGGGAIEMELSRLLRDHAQTIHSKQQLIMLAFAKALEVIPRTLADNAGFDSTDVVTELRALHAKGGKWMGVDIENEGVCDTFKSFVWEPSLVKLNALASATEAACMILSVDETVKNPKAGASQADMQAAPRPR